MRRRAGILVITNHNKHTIATTYVQYKKCFSVNYKDKINKKAIISGLSLVMQISLSKKSTNFEENQTIKIR